MQPSILDDARSPNRTASPPHLQLRPSLQQPVVRHVLPESHFQCHLASEGGPFSRAGAGSAERAGVQLTG